MTITSRSLYGRRSLRTDLRRHWIASPLTVTADSDGKIDG